METIFLNTKDSKANGLHKFVLNLSQRLDLRSSNKHSKLCFSKLIYLRHVEKYMKTVRK